MSSLSWTSLSPSSHPTPLHCQRIPDLNFLHHTSNSNWLHVLHMVIAMFQCYSPNSIFSFPHSGHLTSSGDLGILRLPFSWLHYLLEFLESLMDCLHSDSQWERESIKYLRNVLRCLFIKEVSINHFCPPFSDDSPVTRTLVTSRKARNRSSSIFSVKYLVSLSVSQLWVLNF